MGVGVGVGVAVDVDVAVGIAVGVGVQVDVGVAVGAGVAATVDVCVAVNLGLGAFVTAATGVAVTAGTPTLSLQAEAELATRAKSEQTNHSRELKRPRLTLLLPVTLSLGIELVADRRLFLDAQIKAHGGTRIDILLEHV